MSWPPKSEYEVMAEMQMEHVRLRENHRTAEEVWRLHREGYRAALEGFVWLGNNLHNIKADPDTFRVMFEAALEDARRALNLEPVRARNGGLPHE